MLLDPRHMQKTQWRITLPEDGKENRCNRKEINSERKFRNIQLVSIE